MRKHLESRGTVRSGTPELMHTPSPPPNRARVLFVNTRSALGADVAVHLTLIQNLNPEAIDVYIATNRHSVDLEATVQAVRQAPRARLFVCNLGREMQGRGAFAKLRAVLSNVAATVTLLRLAWLVRTEGISILHTTDRPRDAAFTTVLSMLTGAALVLHVHVKWTATIGRAAQWAAGRATAFIAISEFASRSMVDGGLPVDRIFLAHNATDPTWFTPTAAVRGTVRARLGIGDDVPLVGIVGRFTVWKGHNDLVEAFARVRAVMSEARLVLVGRFTPDELADPGSYVGTIRRRIRELALEEAVDWMEWASDVRGVIADLDVLAMPSWEEPFGLVVTECMAMERPVVGYASGALPELLTDGAEGLLVPPRDTPALADALIALLRDPDRRAAMGARGRQRVILQFSPPRQAQSVTRLYESLTHGRGIPTG
jgi:glycosyltransferase involved in cell wall biosynthesis